MSEPRGTDTRKKSETVRISPDAKDQVRRLAEKWSLSMGDIVEHIIDVFDKVGVKPNDFLEYLTKEAEKAKNSENVFSFLDDECPGRQYVDDKYMCIWARENNTPNSKKIATTDEGARNYCLGCAKTLEIVAGFSEYEDRIKALNAQVNKGVIVKIPACNEGGRISDDGKKLYCNRAGEFKRVTECKTLRAGANCTALRWSTISVKGQFAEGDNK